MRTVSGTAGPLRDWSGSITAAGTAQLAIPHNPMREFLLIQNTTEHDLWVGFNKTPAVGTGMLVSGSEPFILSGHFVSSDVINIYGDTVGQTFEAYENA